LAMNGWKNRQPLVDDFAGFRNDRLPLHPFDAAFLRDVVAVGQQVAQHFQAGYDVVADGGGQCFDRF